MRILNVKITNFKSIYGTQEFDFSEYEGLTKLSGVIGSGKTSMIEALQWGLLGTVKGQNNANLIAWNTQSCEVEINLISKNKNVHIIRNSWEPLIVEIDGKTLSASNKRNTQIILEEDIFDIPKIAITKMCLITFNGFGSLATMNPGETKQFLDDIFGFRTFSLYNDEVVNERKIQQNESIKLSSLYEEQLKQIDHLKDKKQQQRQELESNINLEALSKERNELIEEGKSVKAELVELDKEYKTNDNNIYKRITELTVLGKQEKTYYNTFKSGKCPTCGHDIDMSEVDACKERMMKYANEIKECEARRASLADDFKPKESEYNNKITSLKTRINAIDSEIRLYNNNVQLISENYDSLISEYELKAVDLKERLDKCDIEIGEWNEMNELFAKTLRYKLLNTLIPHINKSIQYYITKLDQPYKIEYDQEFKAHIYIDSFDKEISYSNLSTGQKKTVDLAIIFGILQNLIANVDTNLIFLDELFSNMDSESRNIMLSVLKESLGDGKCIFIVNHAEIADDQFSHKIRVSLVNKRIINNRKRKQEDKDVIVRASKYEKIF